MLVDGEKFLELIPQRPPIVMVDSLISVSENKTVTGFTVNPDNIFVMNGALREPGLIENMAQSAAAGVGYLCRINNEEVPIGYIGAVKNLVIHFHPEVYCRLTTEITIEYEVLDATLIKGCVFSHGKLAAECEMKIFLKKEK